MKAVGVHIDRQSVICAVDPSRIQRLQDISLSVLGGLRPSDRTIDRMLAVAGGLFGGAATAAFLVHRFMNAHLGSPDGSRSGESGER